MTPTEAARRQTLYETEVSRLWAAQPDGAHDIGHLRRVWANAQSIAQAEGGADIEVLLAAAFLHDAVNLPKSHPDRARAARLSADHAAAYLPGTGFPPGKIAAVAHAIAAHSFSAGLAPETPEARILQDADRLISRASTNHDAPVGIELDEFVLHSGSRQILASLKRDVKQWPFPGHNVFSFKCQR